jgi:hypothetical protein
MRRILLPFSKWWVCWPYKQCELDRFEAWWPKADDEEAIYWDGDAVTDDLKLRAEITQKLAAAQGVPSIFGLPIQLQDILSNELSAELYDELSRNPKHYAELSPVDFPEPRRFARIKIIGDGKHALTLRNACIRRLEVDTVSEVHIEDCQLGDFRVRPAHKTADYRIRRSMIGNFVVVSEKDKTKEKEERGYHVQDLEWAVPSSHCPSSEVDALVLEKAKHRCSAHLEGNDLINTASVSLWGWRPSSIASTMSGASSVMRGTRLT